MTIKYQITAQTRKEAEHGSASKLDPASRGSSSEQTLLNGSVQRKSAFGGSGILPSASQVLQLQRTIGNQASVKLLTSMHGCKNGRTAYPGEHSARRYFARSSERGAGQSVIKLDEEKKGGAKWSSECDAVFAHMNNQYGLGGISFHKTRGGVDFIYHMLPPN
ncbi:hypothetical protein [Paenibacillus sp. Soil787]|uniref:hypothetical protein n=1 Tax=Paenibacillus sp. Soil787 TaxID=1736411 RepID=UPI000702FC81|nr:hypothetical protein [Paenibacillus sp. Soil787]KRF21751.1 hypothetical protein ASG93_30645 [Paenibacillus sp. Soil787]